MIFFGVLEDEIFGVIWIIFWFWVCILLIKNFLLGRRMWVWWINKEEIEGMIIIGFEIYYIILGIKE